MGVGFDNSDDYDFRRRGRGRDLYQGSSDQKANFSQTTKDDEAPSMCQKSGRLDQNPVYHLSRSLW